MKRFATAFAFVLVALLHGSVLAQPVPPAPGVAMPRGYYDRIAEDPRAFQFERAWIQKTQRVREAREAFLASPAGKDGPQSVASLPEALRQQYAVGGTVRIPVVAITYTNRAAPFTALTLENQLFNGPTTSAGTLTQLYSEMSYGALNLTGDVLGWVAGSQTDAFYEGGCNGLCGLAKTGQLLVEALVGTDITTNYGQYDNDGPDGLPNSGDDDGFVDFIAVVHPETGGECGGANMWSHRWVVGGWPQFGGGPYVTNDTRFGGGFIRIWDYTIQPAKGSITGCGPGIIEIGIFAHEFGHAFGLPDLYDTDGGGQGIGEHGLMGAGNWQNPPNPEHMSPWSKIQLGWLTPTLVDHTLQAYNIPSVETNPVVFQLGVYEEKFSRKTLDALSGAYSMHCGFDPPTAAARNWATAKGYGNGWDEGVRRTFGYDGNDPVNFEYDVAWACEPGYDFGYLEIEVNGTVSTLAVYNGFGSNVDQNINLTPFLTGSGATSYDVMVRFESDEAWSDEDGKFVSGSTGIRFDNVSVNGGGESYFTDFEVHEDGWCPKDQWPGNGPGEYFLVENRHKAGAQFDQFLHGQGLYIWHVGEGNNTSGTAGTANLRPALLTLEEADGLRDLLLGFNRGDNGDMYPGSGGNTTFNNVTTPNSKSHTGNPTQVIVQNVSAPGAVMTANMRAGRYPPTLASITPVMGPQDFVVSITNLAGGNFVKGAVFLLRDSGNNEYPATNVRWVGKAKLIGDFDLNSVPLGTNDVVVRNPDGQEAVIIDGFSVDAPVPVAIERFEARAVGAGVELTWAIFSDEAMTGFQIYRENNATGSIGVLDHGGQLSVNARSYVDTDVTGNTMYTYTLVIRTAAGAEIRSQPASVSIAGYANALFQNHPNPFNPSTTIRYSVSSQELVSLRIYAPSGQLVRTLVNEVQNPQSRGFAVEWDGRNDVGSRVASGIYLYKLTVGKRFTETRKLLMVK